MDPKPTMKFEKYWTEIKEKFMNDVEKCMLLNSYYWSMWVMMMMNDKQLYDDNTWHWKFIKGHIEDYTSQKAEFGL